MIWFIPITDVDHRTLFVAVEKIRYVEDLGTVRRIYCHSGHMLFINTPLPIEHIAQQLTSIQPAFPLVSYVGENGYNGVVNVAYIAHVEANKHGNADIHCHYSNNRHIIKSQTPIDQFLQQLGQAGARIIGA